MASTLDEIEDLTRQVDIVYKNLLDKFNPAARQLIQSGKSYLKALHGAVAASKVYLEAITKVARQSQQGLWGGSADIGVCLMQMVDVYKEVQAQQMNILKAFYVDLIVPLETNLDKDTKVLQSEQKKFLATHKTRQESYTKAAQNVKKNRKKNRGQKGALDKEIKHLETMEEEKCKLDGFVEQSLEIAVTQERRRYGFILERQCSLAKHFLAFHGKGASLLQHHVDHWSECAKTREELPDRIQAMLPSRAKDMEGIYSTPHCLDDDNMSVISHNPDYRKARSDHGSVDTSTHDLSDLGDTGPSRPLQRARSDFHLDHSSPNNDMTVNHHMINRRSMALPEDSSRRATARALYPYQGSGENQLIFQEGDFILLIGDKNKGWQYGECLRTQKAGWFPVAYTEVISEETESGLGSLSTPQLTSRSTVDETPASNHKRSSSHNSRLPSKASLKSTNTRRDTTPGKTNAVQFRTPSPASTSNADSSSLPFLGSSSSVPNAELSNEKHGTVTNSSVTCPSVWSSALTNTEKNSINQHSSTITNFNSPCHSSVKKSTSQPHSLTDPFIAGSTFTIRRSKTTAHLNPKLKKRSKSASFHSSDDSGFSNEGSMKPHGNTEAEYSDDDSNGAHLHSSNSFSSRWIHYNDKLSQGTTEPMSLPCLANTENLSESGPQSMQYTSSEFDSTTTLERAHKTEMIKHRDSSLPSHTDIDHFVTLRRNKSTSKSPCAQKIAAQRERGREQERSKKTIRRSSSLLCIGINSCRGKPEEMQLYEDIWANGDWKHSSLVDLRDNIPEPPTFQAPAPPTPASSRPPVDYSVRPPMPIPQETVDASPVSSRSEKEFMNSKNSSGNSPQNSSSGNSTLTGSDAEEDEQDIYMVVNDHSCELRHTVTKAQDRRHVSRSLTWAASPQPRTVDHNTLAPSNSSIVSSVNTVIDAKSQSSSNIYPKNSNTLKTKPPVSQNDKNKYNKFQSINRKDKQHDDSPPLPPKNIRPTKESVGNKHNYAGSINITNYSEYMNRRLKYPEGLSRLDQQSYTTGNLCGPWYDLWADDPSVADV